MKRHTARDIHDLKPGFYWYAYPGQRPGVMTIYRRDERTILNFPYPDQTGVRAEENPEDREDLKEIIFIGPIEEPTI